MSKKTILVTGGAGYIGSHSVRLLSDRGYQIIVLDNLVYGHREAIINKGVDLVVGNMDDNNILEKIFSENNMEAVIHFAAYAYVGESVADPAKYYHNNTSAPLALLDMMRKYKCGNFIFSSTCATYGDPEYIPIDENHPQNPINPYGQSKLMLEKIIKDYANAYGLSYVFLRYFNASGASEDGQIGEDHNPETHLIPLVLEAAKGIRPNIKIFGTDYETPDGTCIRDYIHVMDLAEAHQCALEYLLKGGKSVACNLGTGKGVSVKEVIAVAEKITGHKIPVIPEDRRAGDPPRLVANPIKAKEVFGWEAKNKNLETIIKSAWAWMNGPKQGRYNK
ncbi:MAG TPA: UDP-glucose 4-epimerase GalE [Cytophagaceae bacterium]|jgi:UDP-glucose 4-epimerase|nr:UDP-glucose 4-epimerase GalE [Cytophagaceae bacterium]